MFSTCILHKKNISAVSICGYYLLKHRDMDVYFQAKCDTSEYATNAYDTSSPARLEDFSDKMKVGHFPIVFLNKASG